MARAEAPPRTSKSWRVGCLVAAVTLLICASAAYYFLVIGPPDRGLGQTAESPDHKLIARVVWVKIGAAMVEPTFEVTVQRVGEPFTLVRRGSWVWRCNGLDPKSVTWTGNRQITVGVDRQEFALLHNVVETRNAYDVKVITEPQ